MLTKSKQYGFTLVELLIITPIVILAVMGTVALLINLIAENAVTNAENAAAAEVQSALNEIQNSLSSASVLISNDEFSWFGLIDDNASEYIASSPTASEPFRGMRIAANTHDQVAGGSPAFRDTPNGCGANRVKNDVRPTHTIYFAKNVANQSKTELKRRVITNTLPTICNGPSIILQSCEATGATFNCSGDDILARDVVKFQPTYYSSSGSVVSPANSATLANATSVKIELIVKKTIGSKEVRYRGETRFDLLNK